MEFLCTDDEIDMREVAHQFRATALRHAAEEAEDHLGFSLPETGEHSHFPERLLLRHVAHAACIDEHHIRALLVVRQLIAADDKIARDLPGVALVHLAAIGLEKYFRHCEGRGR